MASGVGWGLFGLETRAGGGGERGGGRSVDKAYPLRTLRSRISVMLPMAARSPSTIQLTLEARSAACRVRTSRLRIVRDPEHICKKA